MPTLFLVQSAEIKSQGKYSSVDVGTEPILYTIQFTLGANKNKSSNSAKKLPQDVNSKGVFACNELDLKEVQVYGFDYDYTLACYKASMDYLLYNLGRDMLIERYKVPT